MNILIAALAAVVAVIIAFTLGAYIGSHFYCPRAEIMEPVVPKRREKFIRKRAENCSDSLIYPAPRESKGSTSADTSLPDAERQKKTDAERQRQFEEDLKAFEACMNYSAERAYDMLKGFNVE